MRCIRFVIAAVAACSVLGAADIASRSERRTGPALRGLSMAKKGGSGRSAISYPGQLHIIPQVLDGAGWYTSFIFSNLEEEAMELSCEFVGGDGSLRDFEFTFGTGNTTTSKLEHAGTGAFRTAGTGEKLNTGWAYCWAGEDGSKRFGGISVLRNRTGEVIREVAIPMAPESEPKFTIPYLQSETSPMGVLLINNALEKPATLVLRLYEDNGAAVEGPASQITLEAGQMVFGAVTTIFPDLKTKSSIGSIRVEKTEGTDYVMGMGLRIGAGGVVPIQSMSAGAFPVQ